MSDDVGASFSAERTAWPIGQLHADYMGEKIGQLQVANRINWTRNKAPHRGEFNRQQKRPVPEPRFQPARSRTATTAPFERLNLVRLSAAGEHLFRDFCCIGIALVGKNRQSWIFLADQPGGFRLPQSLRA
jgi:hypothetical protein